jgi:hypothetical protein
MSGHRSSPSRADDVIVSERQIARFLNNPRDAKAYQCPR